MEIGIVRPVNITTEMRTAYLSYAMSVIVSRALPDARDGLKPVQRRILYGMWDMGFRNNQPYKKSARIVGDVLGKMHPHGDSSVYDALARMAQPWNMRYPLVDGQGNFGCFTGDTRIRLLDGTERTFAELAELPHNEIFYVYSVDRTGQIVVGEGRYSRITRREAQLVELIFDDGSTVRCTPDHRFMLHDGSWKQAQELTVEDGLMAGYFATAPVRRGANDCLRVLQPNTGKYEFVHHLADNSNQHRDLVRSSGKAFAHRHRNVNRFDNRPTNIERMAWLEYLHLHAAHLEELWIDEPFRAAQAAGVKAFYAASTHNHRVVAVRWLDERVDVYDITVDEHHNFMLANGCIVHNSVDGDPPAAMRYTEARLAAIAEELLVDIDKNTVDFRDNFDGSYQEPAVLPAMLPNLLLNGAAGIAVGMATNIPPHNLNELCDALMHLIDHPEATVEDLLKILPGPDFPTAASILGAEGIQAAYSTGRGQITLRAKAHIEEANRGAFNIVVTELPYQVNKARLQERMAELVKDKKIEGVRDVRDESDRTGMRLVILLKQDAQPKKVLNALYKHTQMQTTFGINMLALVDSGRQPKVLTLKRMLQEYISHRQEVIRRRTEFDLDKAKARAHILEGLKIALDNIDEVIRTIRESRNTEMARNNLISRFALTEIQANAILDMQLRRLAALERKKIDDEYLELIKLIASLEAILASPRKVLQLIQGDLKYLKEKYGDERRTRIVPDVSGDVSDEDLIPDVRVMITFTDRGYVKRQAADVYRTQRRGGRGIKGMVTREQDIVRHMFTCGSLENLLFFTDRGKVYQLKAHEVPDSSRTAKGLPLVNLISLEPGEQVTSMLAVPDFNGEYLIMATHRGKIKRTLLREYSQVRSNGLIAIGLEDGDVLGWVHVSHGQEDVLLTTAQGRTARFKQSEVRPMGRPATGVNGINLHEHDRVISMQLAKPDHDLLVVTARGMGKRTALEDYPTKGRASGGVITMRLREGDTIAGAALVTNRSLLTLITASGVVMRTGIDEVSRVGRATQGVIVLNLGSGDRLAALSVEELEELEALPPTLVNPNGE